MAEISISILGLRRLGASLGLTLQRYNESGGEHRFSITGYENSQSSAKAAQKLKAVHNLKSSLRDAVKGQDIVVIALPYSKIEVVYHQIADALRPGAVVFDFSPLKGASLKHAAAHLPDETHMVCMTPVVNPKYLFNWLDETEQASADLFDEGVMTIMPGASAVREVVTLATDFTRLLGSVPHFADPLEHDTLAGATEALPALLGAIYFYSMTRADGWPDMQRLTNPTFGMVSRALFDMTAEDMSSLWQDSRTDLLRFLDDYMQDLQRFRALIADREEDALLAAMEQTSKDFETWINRRHKNRWEIDERMSSTEGPTLSGAMGNMFGHFITGRFGRKSDDDKNQR
ncbi:MAG: prephenate dehydrogenase/arogenate dehydrogenase family protein [Phototrophicaceae bacterium]